MKRTGILAILLLVISIVFVSCGSSAGLIVKNSTGFEITEISLSLSSAETWTHPDVLNGKLADGNTFTIDEGLFEEGGVYDLRLLDEDGDYYMLYQVEYSEGKTIYVTLADLY